MGSLGIGPISDKYGRKITIVIGDIFYILGAIIVS